MKVPLTGGAYQARSVIASAQRAVNLYAEPLPQAQGEPSQMAHYPTPGLAAWAAVGTGPIRAIRQASNGWIYVVSGDTVYQMALDGTSSTALGTITPGIRTPVSLSDNGLQLLIVDGSVNGWTVDLASNTFAEVANVPDATAAYLYSGAFTSGQAATLLTTLQGINNGSFTVTLNNQVISLDPIDFTGITDLVGAAALITPKLLDGADCYWYGTFFGITSRLTGANSTITYASAPSSGTDISATLKLTSAAGATALLAGANPTQFYGATRADYLDTYFILNKPGTPQFYVGDSLAVTFDPLWFANKEAAADNLVVAVVANKKVWLIGERTTEIFFDSGAADFPFQAVQEAFVDHGCIAKYSPVEIDNSVFWLSQDRNGQGIVIKGAGYEATRVSTYAIEEAFAGYIRLDDAVGWTYQLGGHIFYVLSFPTQDTTWCFDITTGQWHEWLYIDNNGTEHRHRGNCAYACAGAVLVGDWNSNLVYVLSNAIGTDNGQTIKRVRSYPHLLADGKRVSYSQFLCDLETGTGGNDLPETISSPQVSLRWSDDRGHSWGSPVLVDFGGVGQYLRSLQWQRLGMARDRVFEVSWSTQWPAALQGAWIDARPAQS